MPCSAGVPREYEDAAKFQDKHGREATEILCSICEGNNEAERIKEWKEIHQQWDILRQNLYSRETRMFLDKNM